MPGRFIQADVKRLYRRLSTLTSPWGYPAYEPSEGDCAGTGIPKAGSRFQHRHKGHMVTVLTATEKDVSYRKACGAIGWVGLREFLRLHNEVSE